MNNKMQQIKPTQFVTQINDLWLNKWFLLTSGDFEIKQYTILYQEVIFFSTYKDIENQEKYYKILINVDVTVVSRDH